MLCVCMWARVEDDPRNNVGIGYTKMGSLLDKNLVSHIKPDISKNREDKLWDDGVKWGPSLCLLRSCALIVVSV